MLLAVWQWFSDTETKWRPGVLAPDEPLQTQLDQGDSFSKDGFKITARAKFTARVRVLSRENYWLGEWARMSPVDFAVGWGPMSDTEVLKSIRVSQSGRFFFWQADELPIEQDLIQRSASNWHMVPASSSIARQLSRVHKGDIVTISGSLIDLVRPDGGTINTSLSRLDTGAGACEVIWVESIDRVYK